MICRPCSPKRLPSKPRRKERKTKALSKTVARALNVLDKHVLLDGFKIVIDLEKSRGSYIYDAATGRRLIDLYGFFGSLTGRVQSSIFR